MANSLKINVVSYSRRKGRSFIFSEDDAWFKGCFKDSEVLILHWIGLM